MWTVFAAAMAVAPVVFFVSRKSKADQSEQEKASGAARSFLPWTVIMLVLFGALFILLREKLHFGGDGYALLSMLARGDPLVKFTSAGETIVHQLLCSVLPGEATQRALLSFQILSWVGGLIVVLAAAVTSGTLFSDIRRRILFVLGAGSGGYMLLFFGHVENYSLFVSALAVFAFTGMAAAEGRISRWYVMIPLVFALFFHLFGLTLVPAAIYVLISRTRFAEHLAGMSVKSRIVVATVGLVIVLSAWFYLYYTNYYFQFSFVPYTENRFTLDGYTLFSLPHLVDLLNLLVILIPGLLVLAVVMMFQRGRPSGVVRDNTFLIILTVTTLGAVAVFDPKLGMPRDWDVFAFCGVPLAILIYRRVLSFAGDVRTAGAVVLAIILGFLSLFSRAYAGVDPDIAIARIKNYIALDPLRHRGTFHVLVDYYTGIGDSVSAEQEFRSWETEFPEWAINRNGGRLLNARRYGQAAANFKEVIAINPSFSAAYSNLGTAYLYMQLFDSAIVYLEIANGMNPNNPSQLNNLGMAYYYKGQPIKAEPLLLRAAELDTTNVAPHLTLAMMYRSKGDSDKHMQCLIRAADYPDVPWNALEELALRYLEKGEVDNAARTLSLALEKGMDSTRVRWLKQQYPALPL